MKWVYLDLLTIKSVLEVDELILTVIGVLVIVIG